jgi:hypothetical protein
MKSIVAILALLCASAHAQNQYRCESPDHSTRTHQAEPCINGQICSKWTGSDWSELECDRAKRGNNPCRNSAACWGGLAYKDAREPCERRIELAAKHQAEWTNAPGEPRIAPLGWSDENNGVIIFGGDKIKMQNGFGAWTHMIYSCTWDSEHKRVVDIGVRDRTE